MPEYKQPETGLGSVEETNRLLAEASKQTGIAAPTFPTITADALSGNEQPINIPTPPPSTLAAGITGQTPALYDSLLSQLKTDQEAKATQEKESKGRITSIIESITGKQQEKIEEIGTKDQSGTPAWEKEQARLLAVEFDKSQRAQINEIAALESQNLTGAGSQSAQYGINRKYALQQGDLQLKYHIAQGDYNASIETLNQKFELELEPLKLQLDQEQNVYDQIREDLSKSEDRLWTAKLAQTSQAIKENEQRQSDISDILQTLQTNNPEVLRNNPNLAVQIGNAKSRGEALQILAKKGISLQDPLKKRIDEANLANIYSQIAERNAGVAGMDVVNLLAYAQQYAATGQIPTGLPKGTFGVVSQTAKELPKVAGTVVDRNTGVKSSATGDALQGAYGTIYSVVELAKELKELDKERVSGIVAGTVGKIFGAKDQQRYLDLREQISDLLARARTGAAINATEEKRYFDLLPSRFSQPFFLGADSQVRIDNFISTVTKDLDNKTRTQGLAVYGLSTVEIGGQKYTIGDIVSNEAGQIGRVNPDGSITLVEQ